MARYRVLADSAIGTGFVKAGEIIEYDGKSEGTPGHNLELIKEPLPKRRTAAPAGNAAGGAVAAVYDPDNGLGFEGGGAGAEAGGEGSGEAEGEHADG